MRDWEEKENKYDEARERIKKMERIKKNEKEGKNEKEEVNKVFFFKRNQVKAEWKMKRTWKDEKRETKRKKKK